MPEDNQNGNGRRVMNRRWWGGILALTLISINYYIVLFTGHDLSWFVAYATPVSYIVGGMILGYAVTDAIWNWKK
jgi:hypothetical protein